MKTTVYGLLVAILIVMVSYMFSAGSQRWDAPTENDGFADTVGVDEYDVLGDNHSGHSAGPEELLSKDDELSTSNEHPEPIDPDALSSRFLEAANALEAESTVLQAELAGLPVAQDWQAALDGACLQEGLEHLRNQTPANDPFVAKLIQFCEGHLGRYKAEDLVDYASVARDLYMYEVIDRVAEQWSGLPNDRVTRGINRFLANARFPEEIEAVSNYLSRHYQETGEVLWRPNVVDFPVPALNLVDLQAAALELYACRRFGGCGPNSLKLIQHCAVMQVCEAGWDYEFLIHASFSPLQMEYIRKVIEQIPYSRRR